MEISKPLQEEILSVQSQLRNAIREHQICVIRLKDDPQNTDIRERMREIQLHIVSLGRWQKSVVQQLRNEVHSQKSENPLNGARVTLSSLLGLNINNNNINNNNNHDSRLTDVAVVANIQQRLQQQRLVNGHTNKEDYEDGVRNDSSPIREENCLKKEHSSNSIEPLSLEEEVVELPSDGIHHYINKTIPVAREQQCFLSCLGLITNAQHTKLQNKRAERKRRSTAGSNILPYADYWEVPTKRKKSTYLQGSAPQTRQTTARLNGTSPPPAKAALSSRSSNSSSGSSKSFKSLVQKPKTVAILPKLKNSTTDTKAQKDSTLGKTRSGTRSERATPVPTSVVPQTANAVHSLPRLPSGLTIERIENDTSVCVTCRNPGSLWKCDYCSANFHVSCHTVSPASSTYCPTCLSRFRSDVLSTANLENLRHEINLKKEKEAAAATLYSRRAHGKSGEESELEKASSGLHKTDAGQSRQQQLLTLGIKQLPSSTFLIPISAASSTSSATRDISEPIAVPSISSAHIRHIQEASRALSRLGYDRNSSSQSFLLSKLSQPSLESRLLHHSYGEIVSTGQPLLVVDSQSSEQSVEKRRFSKKKSSSKSKQAVSVLNCDWSNRPSTSSGGSQLSELTISKIGRPKGGGGGNYVTVRITCEDDEFDNRKPSSDNSNDCVYVSESSFSSGAPDVIDLESPPRIGEAKPEEEFDVHNISSGSSSNQRAESPQHLDSQTTRCKTPVPNSSSSGSGDSSGNDPSACSNFLGSIFPGKYGFKLDIIEVGSSAGRSSSSLSSSAGSLPTSPKQNLKSDETDLPSVSSAAEQLVIETVEDDQKEVDETTTKDDEVDPSSIQDVD